jgi:hypothetical protein
MARSISSNFKYEWNRKNSTSGKLIAEAANFFGLGEEVTEYDDGNILRDVINCKLGKYLVCIKQDSDVVLNKVERTGFVKTTTIEVVGITKSSEGKRVIDDICWLLSFASMSHVVPFRFKFNEEVFTPSVGGVAIYFRPTIEIVNGEITRKFLESTWSSYRKLKRSRKLPAAIHMLIVSEHPTQPLESKLAMIFIVLENLKGTYAHYKKIPFVKGYFRKIGKVPKSDPSKERRIYFKELLTEMLLDSGMKASLTRVIALRNEIIHFGLSKKPYDSLIKHHDYCHDLAREYLLRLLGFEGDFWVYSSACTVMKNISTKSR